MIFKRKKKGGLKKYTNKNIAVGEEYNLFNTKWSFSMYIKDYSQLVDVYYNNVEIGVMKDTFKFREGVLKEDRKKLKPLVFEYLKHCYSVKKKNELNKGKEISKKLWCN